jgi:hypothetical protein
MAFWSKITGIIGNIFTLGIGSNAHALKDHTDGIAVRNNADGANANIIIARPQGVNQDIHGATYLDVKQRIVDIEFAFDGDTYTPGSNNNRYGICHTSGGTYTAGAIYHEVGTDLFPVPMFKMMMASPQMTFSGTISMVEDALYITESASAPYAWTLRGGGSAAGLGVVKTIALSFSFSNIGTPVLSTSSIPGGARVLRSSLKIGTPFSGGSNPTCLVEVHGANVDTLLQAVVDNNVLMSGVNYFDNEEVIAVPLNEGGPVQVILGGTATAGTGELEVVYVQPLN